MTFRGDNQLAFFGTYVIVGTMALTIMMETHWLATGLMFFDALYIVPTFTVFFVLSSVVSGAVYFQELRNFTWFQWIMFPSVSMRRYLGVRCLYFLSFSLLFSFSSPSFFSPPLIFLSSLSLLFLYSYYPTCVSSYLATPNKYTK